MKKSLFLVGASMLSLSACISCTQNSATINGNIQNLNDGDTVYLMQVIDNRPVYIDSTTIENQKFVFEKDSITDAEVLYVHPKNHRYVNYDFILEPGTTQLTVDSAKSTIKGTPNNEIYSKIKNEYEALLPSMERDIKPLLSKGEPTPEQKAKIRQIIATKQEKAMEKLFEGIKKNIKTKAGQILFSQKYRHFDDQQNMQLLEMIPEADKTSKFLQPVIEKIEQAQRTAVGKHFTDFKMNDPEGKEIQLSNLVKGHRLTLVDFWASWCGPCRREMPTVVEAYKKYHDKGLQIVGVSFDKDLTAWKDAIEKLNITWPQMSDLKGWQSEAGKIYTIQAIPSTMLIDENGTIIEKNIRGEELVKKIGEILD